MKRFGFVACLMGFACALALTVPSIHAQSYPNRPIQMIIPMAAGAAGDVTGRILAEEMRKILGQPVIVMNKPCASMTLGTDILAKSKKDGYTIGYTNSPAIVYARIVEPENVPYDPIKDLEPLALHLFFPNVLAVQASSPWKTFGELIDYAKKNPGKLRVSTSGLGTVSGFNVEIVQAVTGVELTQIPFKGGESVTTALLGGHVEVTLDAVSKIIPHVEAGRLRMLLLTQKMAEYPNVPTITELGYKQNLPSAWFALYAPAGIPEEVKKVLIPSIEKAIKTPAVKARIEKLGYLVNYGSPAQLKKLMVEEYETANAIAMKIGLRK
jgi:tripartite-type tricarboxylate transporter receptor subunit TctC